MPGMTAYLASLAAGLLVGAIYGVINVRSPAPPLIALVGLLGILVGEQLVPITRHWLAPAQAKVSSVAADCTQHLLGGLPGNGRGAAPRVIASASMRGTPADGATEQTK